MPGVVINVRWPKGMIVAGPGPEDPRWKDWGGAAYITFESATPMIIIGRGLKNILENKVGIGSGVWAEQMLQKIG